MLPTHNKSLAAAEIAVLLVAAVALPVLLYHRKALDTSIVVAIVLLLIAILPGRLIALHGRKQKPQERPSSR
jgi:hypothetical protein